jgi:hypothetical protein
MIVVRPRARYALHAVALLRRGQLLAVLGRLQLAARRVRQRHPAGKRERQKAQALSYLAHNILPVGLTLAVRQNTIDAMQPIDKPDRARQLARAIASDLTLYHEKEIVEGIENDTLFEVMKEHIEEGRALFKSRVTPEIYELNLYDRAIVDVMIKSKGHVKSKIW